MRGGAPDPRAPPHHRIASLWKALPGGAVADLRQAPPAEDHPRDQRRRDLAHHPRDRLRHRQRHRPGESPRAAFGRDPPLGRADLAGERRPTKRARRSDPEGRLLSLVSTDRLRGAAGVHRSRGAPGRSRRRDPADEGPWPRGDRCVSVSRSAAQAIDRRRLSGARRARRARRRSHAHRARSQAREAPGRSAHRADDPRWRRRKDAPRSVGDRRRPRRAGPAGRGRTPPPSAPTKRTSDSATTTPTS